MNHPDRAKLLAYAAGRLPEAEAKGMEAHLETCADCAGVVDTHLDEVVALGRALGPAPVPVEWEDRLMRQVPRPEPRKVTWPPALAKRSRVLLALEPLLALREWDARRDEGTRHYDTIALTLRAFDLIVESSGFGAEVNEETVIRELLPLLHQMDLAAGVPPDRGQHAAFATRLLSRLRNDEEARRPFRATYTDFDQGRPVIREVAFHLLEEQFIDDERFALRLSVEATNLFLSALDFEIEDAQAALEGVIQSQIERGRFEEAVQFARDARARSVQLQEKFDRLLRETRRDMRQVDWRTDMPRLLGEGLSHLQGRLRVEQEVIQTARERLEHLSPGSPEAQQVARIAALIDECFLRHTHLHHVLLGAREVFFTEQDRQAFAPRPRTHLPDLFREVLEPLLAAPRDQALAALEGEQGRPDLPSRADAIRAALLPAQAPESLSLSDLTSWLLRPKRTLPATSSEASELVWEAALPDPLHYPPEVQASGEPYLQRGAARLSQVLCWAAQDAQPAPVLEYLGLRALQAFENDRPSLLRAEQTGTQFEAAGFYGHDLDLQWSAADPEATP
ncbi:zf-HC2 domain-containing protein [Deinococcus aquaedulcis]|uniref:zf-HC2 domain-containing protein n=1 Tax=Deinococcus aquaedulcis TaxID=2840455 RepID=UPI001C83C0AD|nr:zf-HC2 domain-containing protein [Deinococcus aquaedulcis]